jgi:hypothetical protein
MALITVSKEKFLPRSIKLYQKFDLNDFTEKVQKYLAEHSVTLSRGDIVKFSYDDFDGVQSNELENDVLYNDKLIFNGYELEFLSINLGYPNIPYTYQFPEFQINHWVKSIYYCCIVWFDYRPYREEMIRNITFNIPTELYPTKCLFSHDETIIITWVTIGLDVKVYFIFHIHHSLAELMSVRKHITKMINRKSAFDYYEENRTPETYIYFYTKYLELTGINYLVASIKN